MKTVNAHNRYDSVVSVGEVIRFIDLDGNEHIIIATTPDKLRSCTGCCLDDPAHKPCELRTSGDRPRQLCYTGLHSVVPGTQFCNFKYIDSIMEEL